MTQRPMVLGLLLCEQIVVEERTHNLTLVNCFTMRRVEGFPSEPQRFSVFAALTDGVGEVTLDVVIQHLDDLEEIYRQTQMIRFIDPLQQVRFKLSITRCSFPFAGAYEISLLADDELIGQHRFLVI